jgi:hypothetical protein
MQLDTSRAWNEAVAAVQANREVLLAIAGVFFLLPGLVSTVLFADVQEQLYKMMGNRSQMEKFVQSGALTPVIVFGLFASVVQLIGYMAMLAVLTDRARPTVGEALRLAVKSLPTLIGTGLLFFGGYMLATLAFAVVAGVLGKIPMLAPLVFVLVGIFIGLLVSAMVRLSLSLPVIVIDKLRNPMEVLRRSWSLTSGNAGRLLLFYVVMFIVYFVILLLVGGIAGALATLIAGQGTAALLIAGVISGAISAIASVLFTAVLAAVHRQLTESPSATFA